MKISVRHLVFLFLGLFLLKIAVADPMRDKADQKKRRTPASFSKTVRVESGSPRF